VLAVIETLGFVPDASARAGPHPAAERTSSGWWGLERGTDEIDIERSSLLFVDHNRARRAETVLRGTE